MENKKREPDMVRRFSVDGVTVTASLFYAETGKTVNEVIEDYLVFGTEKELAIA